MPRRTHSPDRDPLGANPGQLLTGTDLPWRSNAQPGSQRAVLVLDQPSAARLRIRVNGPIDAGTVVEFDRTTRVASVGAENRVTASHQPLRGQSTSQSQP